MNTVLEIETAVRALSSEELSAFRKWFAEFDAAIWDRQFESDVLAGKLDALGDQALQEFHNGTCKPL